MDEVSIEMAVGLGEVLASAVEEGNPYRFTYNKKTGKVRITEFANFSFAILADPNSSIFYSRELLIDTEKRIRQDYSYVKYSNSEDELISLGKKLGEIGTIIEDHYKCSQDIEGAISGENVYIVQTRPQV